MEVLLDTNAFLWWVTDDEKLSREAYTIISEPENKIFFSVASAWEITIKYQLGKLPLPESPELYIPHRLKYYDFIKLAIDIKDVLGIIHLKNYHKDSCDRLIIV